MQLNGGGLPSRLVSRALAFRRRVATRKPRGETEELADDQNSRQLLAARVANAAHKARDPDAAVTYTLKSTLTMCKCWGVAPSRHRLPRNRPLPLRHVVDPPRKEAHLRRRFSWLEAGQASRRPRNLYRSKAAGRPNGI